MEAKLLIKISTITDLNQILTKHNQKQSDSSNHNLLKMFIKIRIWSSRLTIVTIINEISSDRFLLIYQS